MEINIQIYIWDVLRMITFGREGSKYRRRDEGFRTHHEEYDTEIDLQSFSVLGDSEKAFIPFPQSSMQLCHFFSLRVNIYVFMFL